MLEAFECCGQRMQTAAQLIGRPVILGLNVYSADEYVCGACKRSKFGSLGRVPICRLEDYPKAARLTPVTYRP